VCGFVMCVCVCVGGVFGGSGAIVCGRFNSNFAIAAVVVVVVVFAAVIVFTLALLLLLTLLTTAPLCV